MAEISPSDLLRLIGEQQVEIRMLREALQSALQRIPSAPSPVEQAIESESKNSDAPVG